MGYFDVIRVESPYGGQISVSASTVNDLLDYETRIQLDALDAPGKLIEPPGLWQGMSVDESWREVLIPLKGRAPYSGEEGLDRPTLRLSVLLLSDDTARNLLSGVVMEGVNLLDEAMGRGLGLGTRTCYDDLQDLRKIFAAKDSLVRERIWRIKSRMTEIFEIDLIRFLRLSVNDPVASDAMLVGVEFAAYTATDLIGEGF